MINLYEKIIDVKYLQGKTDENIKFDAWKHLRLKLRVTVRCMVFDKVLLYLTEK